MNRPWLCLQLTIYSILFAVVLYLFHAKYKYLWNNPATLRNWKEIHEGMTLGEVRAILGPEASRNDPDNFFQPNQSEVRWSCRWDGDKYRFFIGFGQDGKIKGKWYIENVPDY